ncbi:LOW QUALITY PROTEIN: hypothetical protein CRUP_030577 [Coryphaenoides rupestris]|nr:LOW QUALITY PROTEIN: hypothetical protein CRUP_030577 [Coryphaenoides rupestris]
MTGDLLQQLLGPEQMIGPFLTRLLQPGPLPPVLRGEEGDGEEEGAEHAEDRSEEDWLIDQDTMVTVGEQRGDGARRQAAADLRALNPPALVVHQQLETQVEVSGSEELDEEPVGEVQGVQGVQLSLGSESQRATNDWTGSESSAEFGRAGLHDSEAGGLTGAEHRRSDLGRGGGGPGSRWSPGGGTGRPAGGGRGSGHHVTHHLNISFSSSIRAAGGDGGGGVGVVRVCWTRSNNAHSSRCSGGGGASTFEQVVNPDEGRGLMTLVSRVLDLEEGEEEQQEEEQRGEER